MQWHPVFAHLLRPLLQDYYDISTNLPVGDVPREADIVLVRRTAPAPFVGVWRHLTTWNIFEFKGPSDNPALRDLDLLFEVALGIDRKLNEEEQRQRRPLMARDEVSWWFVANHIGRRFRAEAELLLGQPLQELDAGMWRCPAFGRVLFLVSRDALPIEHDSMPLHLVTEEPIERQQEVVRTLAADLEIRDRYDSWLLLAESKLSEEAVQMLRDLLTKETFSDPQEFIRYVETYQFLNKQQLKAIIEKRGLAEVIELVGLPRLIEQVGLKQVIDQVGLKQVIDQVGLDALLTQLTPEQLQELKRRIP